MYVLNVSSVYSGIGMFFGRFVVFDVDIIMNRFDFLCSIGLNVLDCVVSVVWKLML